MEPNTVRINLLGLPEHDRLTVLSLPATTIPPDAAAAVDHQVRAEERGRRKTALGPNRDDAVVAAAFEVAEGKVASLALARPDHMRPLEEKSSKARSKLTRAEAEIQLLELRLTDIGQADRRSSLADAWKTLYAHLIVLLILVLFEGFTSFLIALGVAGVRQYPSLAYVPGSTWLEVLGIFGSLLVVVLVIPFGISVIVELKVVSERVRAVATAGLLGASVVAILGAAVLRAVSSMPLATSDERLGGALLSGVALIATTALVTYLHGRIIEAWRRVQALRAEIAPWLVKYKDSVSALHAARDGETVALAEIAAPDEERRTFENLVILAREHLAGENLRVAERVRAAKSVYEQIASLQPGQRAWLSDVFKVVRVEETTTVVPAEA